MLGNPRKFIDDIKEFDGENIDQWKLDMVAPLLKEDFFNQKTMQGKSTAAAFLCGWVINIVTFNAIFKKVQPLKEAADAA